MSNRPDSYWDSADEQTKHMAGILFNHRRFMPWYDDMADYNTDAKSYYDYLARHNAILDAFVDLLNRLLRRELLVEDTVTGKMTQNGTWEEVDDIIISTDVAVSKNTLDGYSNAIKIDNDMTNGGLIAKDFTDEITGIHNDIDNINNEINDIQNQINNIYGMIGGNHNLPYKIPINLSSNVTAINDTSMHELSWGWLYDNNHDLGWQFRIDFNHIKLNEGATGYVDLGTVDISQLPGDTGSHWIYSGYNVWLGGDGVNGQIPYLQFTPTSEGSNIYSLQMIATTSKGTSDTYPELVFTEGDAPVYVRTSTWS